MRTQAEHERDEYRRRQLKQSPKVRLNIITPRRKQATVTVKETDRVRMILDRSGFDREHEVWLGDTLLNQDSMVGECLSASPEPPVFRILPEIPPTYWERQRDKLERTWTWLKAALSA